MPFFKSSPPTIKTLLEKKDIRGLEALMLRTFPSEEAVAALNVMQHLGWQAGMDAGGAALALLQRDFETAVKIGAPAVLPLVQLLKDPDLEKNSLRAEYGVDENGELCGANYVVADNTRSEAQEALVRIGQPAVPILVEILSREDVEQLGCALEPVLEALITIGDPRAMDGFLALLKKFPWNSFPYWRKLRQASQKFKDRRIVPYLKKYVKDRGLDSFQRGDIMNTLSDLGETWK